MQRERGQFNMTAYYNEIEPFAASWLRELIKAGHIPNGEVDERSIEDVKPNDLKSFTQCHFFAGIGVWAYALRQAGWPDDRPVWTGSCPCQPFSTAGKGKGFADERHLWPAFFHLISQCGPVSVFGEQVASKDGLTWLDLVQTDLENTGYAVGAVDSCASGFGAPHLRQRLYWVANTINTRSDQERKPHGVDRKLSAKRPNIRGEAQERGIFNDVAQSSRKRLERFQKTRKGRGQFNDSDPACGLDNSEGGGHRQRNLGIETTAERETFSRETQRYERCRRDDTPNANPACNLANSERIGRERGQGAASGCEHDRADAGRVENDDEPFSDYKTVNAAQPPSPTNGFWRNADWLLCRDEKWRAVEPGAFPLVDGAPNRVGRLRGYGNAIVTPQAKEFIKAFMATEGTI